MSSSTEDIVNQMPRPVYSGHEFSAWQEYVGNEADVKFIEWKKKMVGEAEEKPKQEAKKKPAVKKVKKWVKDKIVKVFKKVRQ